jgi:hypothetical protein
VEPNASPTPNPEPAIPESAGATVAASEPRESPAAESGDAATDADPALVDSIIPDETAAIAPDAGASGIPNGSEILEPSLLDQNPYGILALWDQGDQGFE